jgi:hypothetical protein
MKHLLEIMKKKNMLTALLLASTSLMAQKIPGNSGIPVLSSTIVIKVKGLLFHICQF